MYGVVKLAALSAALAAAFVTLTEQRPAGSGASAGGAVTIDTAPTSRNAPLATESCHHGALEEGCFVTGDRASAARIVAAALGLPEASSIRVISQ